MVAGEEEEQIVPLLKKCSGLGVMAGGQGVIFLPLQGTRNWGWRDAPL